MLRDYQVPHYGKFLLSLQKRRYVFDGSETGTGKTYVALEACKALDVVPLVVGPKAAQGGWEAASETVGVPLEFIGYEKLRGKRKGKTEFDVGLVDSEYLIERPMGKGSQINWKQIPDTVIFDEVHRCSGQTSLASKALIAAKRQANRIIALSASAADDPRQMKALGYALDLHGLSRKAFNKTDYIGWLLRHGCTPGWAGGFDFTRNSEKGEKAFRLLHQEIFGCGKGVRMEKNLIPSFPRTTIDVKLFTADNKAVELASELHEINRRGHAGLAESISARQALEILKIPFLVDAAKDFVLTSKVVFFVNFSKTLKHLQKELPGAGVVWGEQSDAERRKVIQDFQSNHLDFLICNIQAGGESVNLHDPTGKLERTALISPCDSGRRYTQVLGRVHREGGAFSQQYVCFFAGTYEAAVAKRMRAKACNLTLLNDGELTV
jgi:superfamily II DNA or RNA helicase